MGLSFIDSKDREGAAFFVVTGHDTLTTQRLEQLCANLKQKSGKQTFVLYQDTEDARELCDFYDIPMDTLPVAMIIRDDDTLVEMWHGDHIPTVDVLSYQLSQVSGH